MGMGGIGQPGFDAGVAFKAEREALGIHSHDWIAEDAERQLLGDSYPEFSTFPSKLLCFVSSICLIYFQIAYWQ